MLSFYDARASDEVANLLAVGWYNGRPRSSNENVSYPRLPQFLQTK